MYKVSRSTAAVTSHQKPRFKAFFLSLGLLAGLGLVACSDSKQPATHESGPSSVQTLVVTRQALSQPLEALGTLSAINAAVITSNISEKLSGLFFEDGQYVEAGTLLATLEQGEERAQRLAAEAELAEHQREIERLERLIKTQAAARSEYDQRLSQRDQARARIAEAEAKIAERNLHAPFSGHIGLRQVSVGALLSPGTAIVTLDQLDSLKLDFQLPSRALSKLTTGQVIRAYSDALDQSFQARITAIDSRVDVISRSITARAIVKNPDLLLKPGLLLRVEIESESRQGILLPELVLLNRQNRHYVWVVDEQQRAQQRDVEIGTRRNGQVEIVNGLSPGERVISEGFLMLHPGATVTEAGEP